MGTPTQSCLKGSCIYRSPFPSQDLAKSWFKIRLAQLETKRPQATRKREIPVLAIWPRSGPICLGRLKASAAESLFENGRSVCDLVPVRAWSIVVAAKAHHNKALRLVGESDSRVARRDLFVSTATRAASTNTLELLVTLSKRLLTTKHRADTRHRPLAPLRSLQSPQRTHPHRLTSRQGPHLVGGTDGLN